MQLHVIADGTAALVTDHQPKISLTNDEIIDPSRGTIAQARRVLKTYGANYLLSKSNPKTDKAAKFGWLTAPLHLAPGDISGHEMCPNRTVGCTAGCLNTAGNVQYLRAKLKARIARTKFFVEQPDLFKALLVSEIALFVKKARKARLRPSVRLNATSDVVWERKFPMLFMKFPRLTWYDYTKISKRFDRPLPKNYTLTFSRSESNHEECLQVLQKGGNVAVVFGGCGISRFPKPFPETWEGYRVVDGDRHDLRFLDGTGEGGKGVVVGLRAKGMAMKDHSGFVVV